MRSNSLNTATVLRVAGLRATSQRLAVLSCLREAVYPLSIKDLRAKFPHIDQVTLYRMMETLSRVGIVTRIDLGEGGASFEFKGKDDHHHIVCVDCKKIENFIDTAHEQLQKKVLARSKLFAEIINHSFELFGLCRSCIKSRTTA